MDKPNPAFFQSVTDYLLALGFEPKDDHFQRGPISIPFVEIIGFTTILFAEKAEKNGWLIDPEPTHQEEELVNWGNQFLFIALGGFGAD